MNAQTKFIQEIKGISRMLNEVYSSNRRYIMNAQTKFIQEVEGIS